MLITSGNKRVNQNLSNECLKLTSELSFLLGIGFSLLFSKFPDIPFPCLRKKKQIKTYIT